MRGIFWAMNYESREKLEKFLNKKLENIADTCRGDAPAPALNIHYIKTVKGFDNKEIQTHNRWGDGGYNFFNSNNCQCLFYYASHAICVSIDEIFSGWWHGSIGMLYRCMDEMNEIAEEFRKLKGELEKQEDELEKQEKIEELTKNSIYTWLETLMQNQPYSYYTIETENQIKLLIKLKNSMQLEIPIYYSRFQEIMPEILETIKRYEETVNKSKIKILINNSKPNQKWITS